MGFEIFRNKRGVSAFLRRAKKNPKRVARSASRWKIVISEVYGYDGSRLQPVLNWGLRVFDNLWSCRFYFPIFSDSAFRGVPCYGSMLSFVS